MDKLLRFGSSFDWITPLVAYIQDWLNGPSVAFSVPESAGWTCFAISSLLRSKGIKVWGLMYVNDHIIFKVKCAQARYADYLLTREGMSHLSGLELEPLQQEENTARTNPVYSQGRAPRTQQKHTAGEPAGDTVLADVRAAIQDVSTSVRSILNI